MVKKISLVVLVLMLVALGLVSCKKSDEPAAQSAKPETMKEQQATGGGIGYTAPETKSTQPDQKAMQKTMTEQKTMAEKEMADQKTMAEKKMMPEQETTTEQKTSMGGLGDITQKVESMAKGLQFSLPDQDGKQVSLSDYKDKIVVLEWTNPECPFVQRHYENNAMPKLAQEYQQKGIVWLAIDSTGSHDLATDKEWFTTHKLSYPILNDHSGIVGKMLGAKSTPHIFIINTNGKVAYQGAVDDDPQGEKGAGAVNYVRKALDALLTGKTPEVTETKSYGCSVKYAQ
ncbi:MAG: redoxin domain-containing protein [Sedimentisphaerales bacterium]|nr:redoxin domain-containing protein [Sedimentisphaerales bacterium]